MSLTAAEIIQVMERARELGVKQLKVGEIEACFDGGIIGNAKHEPVPDQTAEQLVKPMSVLDQFTDEEIKYYATPYFEELMARKAEHAKKLAEETDLRSDD